MEPSGLWISSGEHITHFEEGRPLFVRTPESHFSLANFMRVNLYTSLGALKTGLDILLPEKVWKWTRSLVTAVSLRHRA